MNLLSKYGIVLIVGFGLILRLININQSLWLDEAISALVARDYTFSTIVWEFLKGDNHPPLFYLMLRFWGLVFGFSDFSLRLLPVLFGTLTIVLTYLLINKLINRPAAIIASLFISTSPLHVYYSQELRMYPVVTFWAVLLMYWYLKLMTSKPVLWKWFLFSLGLIGFIATDYIGLFLLPVFFILALKEKVNLIKLILSFIPLIVAFIWWIPIFLQQKEIIFIQVSSLPGWGSMVGGASIREASILWMKFVLGRISFYPKILYYLLVGIFSVPIVIGLFRSFNKRVLWLWIYLLVPLGGSLISSVIVPSFNYSRLIFVLPAFYGLVAYGLIRFSPKVKLITVSLVLIGNIIGLGFYFGDTNNQREQWKQAVFYIESLQPDLALFEFPEPFAPYTWYSHKTVKAIGGLTQLSSISDQTTNKIERELANNPRRIIYISYLRDLTDPDMHIQKVLAKAGYKNSFSKSFVGVGEVILYAK